MEKDPFDRYTTYTEGEYRQCLGGCFFISFSIPLLLHPKVGTDEHR